MSVFALPDFSKDINEFKQDLKAIRQLLEKLLELEEQRPSPFEVHVGGKK